ncbi:catalase family peroxidase [Sphingomonas sp. RB3P16]|uniref:catalase family peroxidase n=1 Tax=Parasphingomonas frigoris TaxID=3096163 RepID=UPI002FCB779C
MKKIFWGGAVASLSCASCLLLAQSAPAQSTLPPGVQVVPPADSRTIADPEQLAERTPGHLIQDLHAAFGSHGARAVHSKGTMLTGYFEPAPNAHLLSSAALFRSKTPVIARFSDFTGIPDIPDTQNGASPRGFAIKFLLPDGSNYDVVNHSFNGFPVSNASQFGELLEAIAASGAQAPKPTALDAFFVTHPVAKTFLTSQAPPPVSWATTAYFGVNSFQFIDGAQHARFVRYRFVPDAGERYLSDAELVGRSPDYLASEITSRVSAHPVRFTWYAQIAEPGDVIEDPSIAWPNSRELIKLGVITLDRVGSNSALADRSVLFLPGTTPPGIALADPMLAIRNAAYPLSFHERQARR